MAEKKLTFVLGANIQGFLREMDKVTKNLNKISRDAQKSLGPAMEGIRKSFVAIGTAAAASFGAASAAGIKLNADLEQSKVAFTTLLGSAQAAEAFLEDMRDFAMKTPFQFMELQSAAKRMLAFGFSAQQVRPILTAVGDAVSGLGGNQETMDRVILAMGQMQTKGRVMAQEMNQLSEAGIPGWQMLADKMGLTTAEVMKMSEKGLLPANEALNALVDGMENKFGGMMAKQSKTMLGLWSNFKDLAEKVLTDITGPVFESLKKKMDAAAQSIQKWQDNGQLKKWVDSVQKSLLSFWKVAEKIFNALVSIGKFVADHWGLILPILSGILAGFLAFKTAIAVIQGMKLAMAALNLVMSLNPISLVVIAIAALVAAGVALYKNWDKVRYYGLQAWGALKVGVLSAISSLLGGMEKVLGWIPGLGEKISAARKGIAGQIATSKSASAARMTAFTSSEEERASKAAAQTAAGINYPSVDETGLPSASSADKSSAAADKVKTAWIGTADQVRNALQMLQTQHETAAIKAEMQGDKLAELKLKESQLNEEYAKQKEVVAAVQREITANTKAGVLEGETKEDLVKRTDELNAKLADEQKAQADLEKQLYDTQEAIKDQAEQLKALSQEVVDVKKKYDEELTQALEDYQKKVAEVNAKLADDEAKLTEEYENQLDQRADALSNFVDLFDAVTSKDVSGKTLLENLRGQVKTFGEWSANIQKLASRGIDEGLLGQLREMGPKAAPEIAALTTLTDDELTEYVALWRQKNEDARNEAIDQLEGQRSDMEEKMQEIRDTAAAQLAQYEAEWKDTQEKIRQNVLTEMQTIQSKYEELVGKGKSFGLNFMDEFGLGMVEGFLRVQEIISQKMLEMETLFPAHSPAEKGPLANLEKWGRNFVSTFAAGIRLEMPNLSSALSDLVSVKSSPSLAMSGTVAGSSGNTYITLHFNGADPEANWKYFKRQLALSGMRAPSR